MSNCGLQACTIQSERRKLSGQVDDSNPDDYASGHSSNSAGRGWERANWSARNFAKSHKGTLVEHGVGMKLETHMELVRQWDITLSKIDPQEDHVAALEICMMMGTNLLNAIFHKQGIRDEQYDQNHTDRPPIPQQAQAMITPDVRAMIDELHYIETMRNLYCRGITGNLTDARDLPDWDPAVSVKCIGTIRKMQAFLDSMTRA